MQKITKQGRAKRKKKKDTNQEHTESLTIILAGRKSGVLERSSSNQTSNIQIITILVLQNVAQNHRSSWFHTIKRGI